MAEGGGGWRSRLARFDARVADWMERVGHPFHRWAMGVFFVWLGLLKVFGYKSATSILAETIYLGDPGAMVRVLGAWEVGIGVCLLWRPLVRVALLLLALRLPGVVLAFVAHPDVCFEHIPLVPTPAGQYLIKELVLVGAALVIGGTVREEDRGRAG